MGEAMHIYNFATDDQLDAGIKWHMAIIEHLDKEARPERFRTEGDRIRYFGVVLPERLASLNVLETFNLWLKSQDAGALGCGLLQTLHESTRDLSQIRHEMWLREQDRIPRRLEASAVREALAVIEERKDA